MLRHGCGYALANAGHDTRSLRAYLGHIRHTVRYTELAPDRFKDFLAISGLLGTPSQRSLRSSRSPASFTLAMRS